MGREGQAEVRCKEEIETGEMGKTGWKRSKLWHNRWAAV